MRRSGGTSGAGSGLGWDLGRRLRLLVLEDNPLCADLFRRALASFGDVDCQASIGGAERAWREAPFDAMVVDIHLPDGDGLDWATAKSREAGRLLPVLVVTGDDRGPLRSGETLHLGLQFLYYQRAQRGEREVPALGPDAIVRWMSEMAIPLMAMDPQRLVHVLARLAKQGSLNTIEQEVLRLTVAGYKQKEIAVETGKTMDQVRAAVRKIMKSVGKGYMDIRDLAASISKEAYGGLPSQPSR